MLQGGNEDGDEDAPTIVGAKRGAAEVGADDADVSQAQQWVTCIPREKGSALMCTNSLRFTYWARNALAGKL